MNRIRLQRIPVASRYEIGGQWCVASIAVFLIICSSTCIGAQETHDAIEMLPPAVVTGSKGRVIRIDAHSLFTRWCHPPKEPCLVALKTEPRKGDLFADHVRGPELHLASSASREGQPYCHSNQWVYQEGTFLGENDSGDGEDDSYRAGSDDWGNSDDDNYDGRHYHSEAWDTNKPTYGSGKRFDNFTIVVFSPPAAEKPVAQRDVVISIINHKPIGISSTLILRAEDPWTTFAPESKVFAFAQEALLQGYDPDYSEENLYELKGPANVSAQLMDPSTLTVTFKDQYKQPLESSEMFNDAFVLLTVSDNLTRLSNGEVPVLQFALQYSEYDAEGAQSAQPASTFVTVIANGTSNLPDAPLVANPYLHPLSVPRVFGIPSVVLCRFQRSAASSDCHFRLFGGDLLSSQVVMSASVETEYYDILPNDLISISASMSTEVESEGSFRLLPFNGGNPSADGYYPYAPALSGVVPLFSSKFTLSEITPTSPPDCVSTTWQTVVKEIPKKSDTGESSAATSTSIASNSVPLKIYSPFLSQQPQLVCHDTSFDWSHLVTVPPPRCGHTTEYDNECIEMLTAAGEVQTVATLKPFRVEFDDDGLRETVWQKDDEAAYVIVHVEVNVALEQAILSSGGCVFHRQLFREVVVGDYIRSEADLLWMPMTQLDASSSRDMRQALCKHPHLSIRLAMVIGSNVGCDFSVAAPREATPPSTIQDLYRVLHVQSSSDALAFTQNDDDVNYAGGGAAVFPFALSSVVESIIKMSSASTSSGPRSAADDSRMLTYVPNVAAHTLMYSYSNGPTTYPLQVVSGSPASPLFVPRDAFASSAPSEVVASSRVYWLSHVRRLVTLLITAGSRELLHRQRRVSFRIQDVPSSDSLRKSPYYQDWAHVFLRRERASPPTIQRRGAQCKVDDSMSDGSTVTGISIENSLLREYFTQYLSPLGGSQYVENAALKAAMRLGISAVYEVFLEEGSPQGLWFQSSDLYADGLMLSVTRMPQFTTVASKYASSKDAPSWIAAVASRGVNVTDTPLDLDACAALVVERKPNQNVDLVSGTINGFADDELRVVMTDGVTLSNEIVIILRLRKSTNVSPPPSPTSAPGGAPEDPDHRHRNDDGFGSTSGASAWSMDAPLLLLSIGVLGAVVFRYRRKLHRMIVTRDVSMSDSSEDNHDDGNHHQSRVTRTLEMFKTIRSMVAPRSNASGDIGFSRIPQHDGGAALSDEDDDDYRHGDGGPRRRGVSADVAPFKSSDNVEMHRVVTVHPAPHGASAVSPSNSEHDSDDWDNWEVAGCRPHPSTVATTNNTASPPAAPKVQVPAAAATAVQAPTRSGSSGPTGSTRTPSPSVGSPGQQHGATGIKKVSLKKD